MSQWYKQTSEWTSEWPITYIPLSGCSESQCCCEKSRLLRDSGIRRGIFQSRKAIRKRGRDCCFGFLQREIEWHPYGRKIDERNESDAPMDAHMLCWMKVNTPNRRKFVKKNLYRRKEKSQWIHLIRRQNIFSFSFGSHICNFDEKFKTFSAWQQDNIKRFHWVRVDSLVFIHFAMILVELMELFPCGFWYRLASQKSHLAQKEPAGFWLWGKRPWSH